YIKIHILAILICNHTVGFSFQQHINGISAHNRCINPVLTGGTSASLHVSQDRRPGSDSRGRLNTLGHTGGMADAFRIDDDMMLFTPFPVFNYIIYNLLLVIVILFRNQDILRPVGNTAPQSDITGAPSHYLDDAAPLMGGGGISYFVNGFHGSI